MPLTKPQLEIYHDPTRFRVIIAGRRFGKSVLCLNELIRAAQTGYNLDVYYVAPYLKMAKGILWPMLKAAIPQSHIKYKNEQELLIELKQYNSRIHLVGADNPDSLRGITVSFLVADEIQDIDLQVLDTILLPAMSDQKADGIYIGTPKGKGNNTAYQLYLRGKTVKGWKSWQFTTADGGNVDPEEIEAAKSVMSAKQFEQEFLASFISMQGRVYYNFDITDTLDGSIFDRGLPLHVGLDFNVGKMCAVVCQEFMGKVEVIDEFVLVDSNTREMCQAIKHRYPDRNITIYPDPSGKARKTSSNAGQTDFSIIRDKEFGFEFHLLAKNKHPAVADRVNNVNAMLMSADGTRKLKVSPKAVEVVKCLDGQVYKDGTNQPDKDGGLDHMCFSGDTLVDIMGLGVIQFMNIPERGFVASPFGGWVEYTNGGLIKADSELVSVLLSDGNSIKCTPEHKFLTASGWVEAKDLTGLSLICNKKLLSLAKPSKNTKVSGIISVANTFRVMGGGYTGFYGKGVMERSPKVAAYTTLTETLATIKSVICNYFPKAITPDFTTQTEQSKFLNLQNQDTTSSKKKMLSGEVQSKEFYGQRLTTNRPKKNYMQCVKTFAVSVAAHLSGLLGIRKSIGFAVTDVNPHTERLPALMTREEIANVVENCTQQTNTHQGFIVKEVVRIPNEDVYCLTTNNFGCFSLANGIVTSNCDALGYYIDYRFDLIKREVKTLTINWAY